MTVYAGAVVVELLVAGTIGWLAWVALAQLVTWWDTCAARRARRRERARQAAMRRHPCVLPSTREYLDAGFTTDDALFLAELEGPGRRP